MKQLEENTICRYCFGCNKLLLEEFNGVKHCNGFISGYSDWQERYYKALKEEKKCL